MYWTIQSDEVIDAVEKQGLYSPDFSLYAKDARYKEAYEYIRRNFVRRNAIGDSVKGVVFAFDDSLGCPLTGYESVVNFLSVPERRDFISKSRINEDLWKKDSYYLLQLDYYPKNFNPLPIDVAYFTLIGEYLADPSSSFIRNVEALRSISVNDVLEQISMSWENGEFYGWFNPHEDLFRGYSTNMLQMHLPYIKEENIVNKWPIEEVSRVLA